MGNFYDSIPANFVDWILAQHVFWVASAPLSGSGHVNVSPKGLQGSFHYVNENKVWYEDFSGSGSETMAHLKEPGNGRITIMFSAFEGRPRILRLWGTGTVHEFGTLEYDALIPSEKRRAGVRAAIVVDVHKVGTSCGFGVPLYSFNSQRPTLINMSVKAEQGDEAGEVEKGMKAFWSKMNLQSMDGLPSMEAAHISDKHFVSAPLAAEATIKSLTPESIGILEKAKAALLFDRRNTEVIKTMIIFMSGMLVTAVYVRLVGAVQV